MKNVLFIAIMLFTFQLSAQDMTDRIKSEAIKFNNFLLEGKYEQYCNMMNPSVVYGGGGPKLMAEVEENRIKAQEKAGIKILSITPIKVEDLTQVNGGGFQGLLTQEVLMTVGKDMFRKEGYYFVASDPDGKYWNFIDLEPYDQESIQKFIPEFSEDIKIPEPYKAEIVKK